MRYKIVTWKPNKTDNISQLGIVFFMPDSDNCFFCLLQLRIDFYEFV